jgi:hypothetical protein
MYGDVGENDNIISRSLDRIAKKDLIWLAAAKHPRISLRTSRSSERIYL